MNSNPIVQVRHYQLILLTTDVSHVKLQLYNLNILWTPCNICDIFLKYTDMPYMIIHNNKLVMLTPSFLASV
jgi:hypothetical protein